MVKRSIRRVLMEQDDSDKDKYLIYDDIIEGCWAKEGANQKGCTPEEYASMWFRENYYEGGFIKENFPKHYSYVCNVVGYLEMYYDYGGDYYFCVIEK